MTPAPGRKWSDPDYRATQGKGGNFGGIFFGALLNHYVKQRIVDLFECAQAKKALAGFGFVGTSCAVTFVKVR